MSANITNIAGIGSATASVLVQHKFKTVASIAHAEIDELSAVPGFSTLRAEKTINAAKQLLDSTISNLHIDTGAANAESINETTSIAEIDKPKKEHKEKNKDKKLKAKNKDKKKDKKNKKNKNKNKKKNKKGK
ncbi:MAG: helix-hairpin-helix domain-containing protein [Gammaproteobacteria bacterium]|nr:helix-hairpin-helix domain-containing protein [Gammaproteobacteria bacterium]